MKGEGDKIVCSACGNGATMDDYYQFHPFDGAVIPQSPYDWVESERRDITIKCVKGRDTGFSKRYITLNAPYCRFEPYDPDRPNTGSKRKRQRVTFVEN